MDSTPARREAIKRIIKHHAQFQPSHGEIRVGSTCDDQTGVYAIVYAGWDQGKRVHGMLLLIRLEGDKVVVEYDGIYHGVFDDLITAGIPADEIVLAFRRNEPLLAVAR